MHVLLRKAQGGRPIWPRYVIISGIGAMGGGGLQGVEKGLVGGT